MGWIPGAVSLVGNLAGPLLNRHSQNQQAGAQRESQESEIAAARSAHEAEESQRAAKVEMIQRMLSQINLPGLNMAIDPTVLEQLKKPRPFSGTLPADPRAGGTAGMGSTFLNSLGAAGTTAALGGLLKPKPGQNPGQDASDVAGGAEGGAQLPATSRVRELSGLVGSGGAMVPGAAGAAVPIALGAAGAAGGALAGNSVAGSMGTNRAAGTAAGALNPLGAGTALAGREAGRAIAGETGARIGQYAGYINPAFAAVSGGQKLLNALKGLF